MMQADCRCGNVSYEKAEALLKAAKNALVGMSRGRWDAPCHHGCKQCQRVDGLRAAIKKAEEE